MSADSPSPRGFSGTGRLFPLPNVVLFPHRIQPLHVFEPRYQDMMADALGDNRLLAMALLRPGWEEDYHKAPPIHPVVCLARITNEQKLPDGRYNFLVYGLCRARVVEELQTGKPYRIARLEPLADVEMPAGVAAKRLRRRLKKQVDRWFAPQPSALKQLRKLLKNGSALGAVADVCGAALPLDIGLRQELLEEVGVGPRVELLLSHLEVATPPGGAPEPPRKFPPEFSSN